MDAERFDGYEEVDFLSEYISEEELLPGGANVYIWPGKAADPEVNAFAEIVPDDNVETVYTFARRENSMPEPSSLQSSIQLFAGRHLDDEYLSLQSIPETYGVDTLEGARELQEEGELPEMDLELSWPAPMIRNTALRNTERYNIAAKGKGKLTSNRAARHIMAEDIGRSDEMLADDGTLLMRVDDFKEKGCITSVDSLLDEDAIDVASMYASSDIFGFEETYLLDEASTDRTYIVGKKST